MVQEVARERPHSVPTLQEYVLLYTSSLVSLIISPQNISKMANGSIKLKAIVISELIQAALRKNILTHAGQVMTRA